jgi:putative ABC transport system permease protein
MRSVLAHARAWWRGLRRPAQLDAEMQDEMRFHIDMEAQRLRERGLSPTEASRQAAIAFGGVEKYRGAGRDALQLTWLRGLSTDFKLGGRMLSKHPGLTAVALFALSLAIGAGAAYLEFVNDLIKGRLPFADADRIVAIETWDRITGRPDRRNTSDFVAWRDSLSSIETLAAARQLDRDLRTGDGRVAPVAAAQISAAAFTIAQVPPLLCRGLQPADEQPGAPPVAVIGESVWAARFASDPAVIGQLLHLGGEAFTIVGVMPPAFGLPISEQLWVPLPLNDDNPPPRQGPTLRVFGKLAPGVTLPQAQAELDTFAQRAASASPATHRHLQPIVRGYVDSLWAGVEDSQVQTMVFYGANVLFVGLLILCGANVATLVFARTATRETELSVRTALGASRSRIAGQLFVEALVLSGAAALIGLTFASYSLLWVKMKVAEGMGESLMFWWDDRLAPMTIAYAAGLACLSALIVGVVPALKATGATVQDRLKQSTGASGNSLKFGGVWTGVIVSQVAVTVVFLAIVGLLGWSAYVTGGGKRDLNFQADQYVSARLMLDGDDSPTGDPSQAVAYRGQFRSTYAELARRLEADPAMAGVTYGERLPGMTNRREAMDIQGSTPPAGQPAFELRTAMVAPGYFDAFTAPIIAGRNFSEADLAPGRNVAIVDRTFVRRILNGGDAVGRQVRRAASERRPAGPWIEIVGVVADLTDDTGKLADEAWLYLPAAPETTAPFYIAIRARTTTAAAMAQLRAIAVDVDPALRVLEMMTIDQLSDADRTALDFFARLMAGVSVVAIVLASAGIYALMSFTVARRTQEIGIRFALGADPRGIVRSTFGGALAKVCGGLVAGSIPAGLLVWSLGPEVSPANGPVVAIVTGAFSTLFVALMAAVATAVPARRALRIQPMDALKAE